MKKYVLTVTLNPALDKMLTVNHLAIGKDSDMHEEFLSAGGKGLNVARVLKNLGVHTLATGFLGGKTGEIIEELLDEEGIKNDFIKIQGETRVNVMVHEPDLKNATRLLGEGPQVNSVQVQSFKKKYAKLLKQSSMVVLSGRNAHGAPVNLYAELIRLAHEKNIPVIVDTSGEPLQKAVEAKPLMMKPNLREIEEIFYQKLNTKIKMKKAVDSLLEKGVGIVLLSLAEKGGMIANKKERWMAKPPVTKVLNDVGCGDSMVAGFVYAFIKEWTLKECLRYAVAAGTANVTKMRPGAINPRDVKQILKFVKIQKQNRDSLIK